MCVLVDRYKMLNMSNEKAHKIQFGKVFKSYFVLTLKVINYMHSVYLPSIIL